MSSQLHSQPAGTISYHEPALPALLTLIALLYLLQVARGLANRLLGAGLLGEIAVGVVFGPCAKILDVEWERTFVAVGYIGLVLIVFEGGLTLKPSSFLSVLPLALVVAMVGILLPMAFTFALFSASSFGYPPLQAFTAGSALASTSLGTTFFVLRSAGPSLSSTRAGEILKGAALFDDVVALVLLSVIQSLGPDPSSATSGLGWTIGRPIVASVALAAVAPVVARWVVRPVFRTKRVEGMMEKGGKSAELFVGVCVLSAFLAISYYTGTTMLLGAFLAGTFLTSLPSPTSSVSFIRTWDEWLVPIHEHILTPLFFASIGFSLPFLSLWTGPRIWKGIVYAVLMALGKLLTGAPILLVDVFSFSRSSGSSISPVALEAVTRETKEARTGSPPQITDAERVGGEKQQQLEGEKRGGAKRGGGFLGESVQAAAFVGLALVARGEIGILVLQVAYSSSSSSSSSTSSVLSEEPYLIAIWAVALCTIVGPVAFAALVKRGGSALVRGRWGLVGGGQEERE
ncbi:hypothetical protein JCM8547_002342 [Rhodosporidiobolus lusitaniae]